MKKLSLFFFGTCFLLFCSSKINAQQVSVGLGGCFQEINTVDVVGNDSIFHLDANSGEMKLLSVNGVQFNIEYYYVERWENRTIHSIVWKYPIYRRLDE